VVISSTLVCYLWLVTTERTSSNFSDLEELLGTSSLDVAREALLASGLAGIEGTLQAKLVVNTLNTVGGVDVLDQSDLVASSTTLARGDGAVGEEVLPDLCIDVSLVRS
jgi:hypothetical protein